VHEKAIEKINGKIFGSLKRCEVVENWPQYESFTNHVDSLAKEITKHKSEWLTRTDVYSVYYDFVYEFIVSKAGAEEKISGLLSELVDVEELQFLANTLTEFYLSVPRQYSIYLPLPRVSKNIGYSTISISDSIRLVSFDKSNDVPGGYSGGLLQFSNRLELNKVYLKIDVEGYCSNRLENKTLRRALSNFKILIQQGLFKGLFKVIEGQPAGMGLLGGVTHYQIPKSSIVSVDMGGETERIISTELPIEISKLLDSVDFDWGNEKVASSLKKGSFDAPVSGYLRFPALLVESSEPESEKIKAAIEWCFDSKANENETLSFLQICIGLEALLGDTESNGSLTETLADRCAYLISGDIKGRSEIKNHFKDLYRVRSKLVHGVKTTLEHDQKWYKDWGQNVLEFAIIKEIKHLNLK